MTARRSDLRAIGAPAGGRDGVVALRPDAPPTFSALYARYWRYVARIAHRMLGRDTEVEDILQEVFLIALERLPRLDEESATRAWLGAVTVKRVARLLRWRRVRAVLRLDDADLDAVVGSELDPEQRSAVGAAYRILDRVPINHRMAWVLRFVEEEPLERVATMCGCSLATAKRWIAAAEERMKELGHA